MSENTPSGPITGSLRDDGFVFVRGDDMRAYVQRVGSLDDWDVFRASWDTLEVDAYLAATGRRRRRRHAVFRISPTGEIERQPHQAHYQAAEYNTLQGGIPRYFEPISPLVGASHTLTALLRCAWQTFTSLVQDARSWKVEVHQMRIEATSDLPGEPTPEGVHRDGVDFVLVLLVSRRNIVSGTTTIFTPSGQQLGSFTLTVPLDSALVDDARVWHGVTAVQPQVPGLPASRDVLVVTLKAIGQDG